MAVAALVFCVTHVAAMFAVLCFELWPFTRSATLMKQPALGIAWTATTLAITTIAFVAGVQAFGDAMVFLTRVSVPFIFGSIIVLNMLQGSLFPLVRQPLKGVLNVTVAALSGALLARLYGALAPAVSGPVAAGSPDYIYEIWLANALLAITFPLLVFHAAFFAFWPLKRLH